MSYLLGQANALHLPLPDRSVQMCVTSPPYWGLRDYGTATWEGGKAGCDHKPSKEWIDHNFNAKSAFGNGAATQSAAGEKRWYKADGSCPQCGARRIDAQLGLEPTPDEFTARMVGVFREVKRVLRDDGTCWVNMGDSYAFEHCNWPRWVGWQQQEPRWNAATKSTSGRSMVKDTDGRLWPQAQKPRWHPLVIG